MFQEIGVVNKYHFKNNNFYIVIILTKVCSISQEQ